MAVNPLHFTQPVAGISETLDRSGAGFGGAGLPGAGAQALPGAALRFAGALRQALESGGPEALDQMAQAGMGAQFMTLMEGGEGAGQAQGLSDMHALLDALEGTGQGDGAGFAGLSGGTVPGGKGVQALIRALSAGGLSPVAGTQDAAAAPGPWGAQGPERADGLRRVGASQGPAGGLAPGARVGAPAAQPAAASEAPAREAEAAGAARTARAHRAYGKAAAPGASGVDILGLLSARFESGGDIGAVGYDRVGGTSYGSYQISSRAGTFTRFLEFLDSAAPDIAGRLRKAGPANTGSTRGAMPETWKAVAREEPERFSRLQHEFISQTHYLPALRKITDLTGVDLSGRHQAIAQVLWSTAVQHGASGSARIFSAALDALGGMAQGPDFERGLIREVYARRAGRFGSSDARVQGAVQSRFAREMGAALSMLDGAATLDHNA